MQHATPASSYAHSASRKWYSDADLPASAKRDNCTDIAAQLLENTDIDVRNLETDLVLISLHSNRSILVELHLTGVFVTACFFPPGDHWWW